MPLPVPQHTAAFTGTTHTPQVPSWQAAMGQASRTEPGPLLPGQALCQASAGR